MKLFEMFGDEEENTNEGIADLSMNVQSIPHDPDNPFKEKAYVITTRFGKVYTFDTEEEVIQHFGKEAWERIKNGIHSRLELTKSPDSDDENLPEAKSDSLGRKFNDAVREQKTSSNGYKESVNKVISHLKEDMSTLVSKVKENKANPGKNILYQYVYEAAVNAGVRPSDLIPVTEQVRDLLKKTYVEAKRNKKQVKEDDMSDDDKFTAILDRLYNDYPDLYSQMGDEYIVGLVEDHLKRNQSGDIDEIYNAVVSELRDRG